jgi:hypothetical protein
MPTGIPAGTLARMRRGMNVLLPDTCTLYEVEQTNDGAGGVTETLRTVADDEPCRFDPSNARSEKQTIGGRSAQIVEGKLTLRHNSELAAHMRIVYGGSTWRVKELTETTTPAVYKQAVIVKVD